jgi:hypothetical protein
MSNAMRKVRLKVTFTMDYECPADWDDDLLLFHVNESSSCMDNLLAMRLEQSKANGGGFCTCSEGEAVLVPPGPEE